jgi:hypothetical protein
MSLKKFCYKNFSTDRVLLASLVKWKIAWKMQQKMILKLAFSYRSTIYLFFVLYLTHTAP